MAGIRRSADSKRWDDRRLWDRIVAEARFRQIDLSKYCTTTEAMAILGQTRSGVMWRFDWLLGVTICGRHFVRRDRAEWLNKFRKGTLPGNDLDGESLAPFDVHAARAEKERKKREEEDARRQEADSRRQHGFQVDRGYWFDYDNNDTWVNIRQAAINLNIHRSTVHNLADNGVIRRRYADPRTWEPVEDSEKCKVKSEKCKVDGRRQMCGYRAMFSLRDIEAYVERQEERGRKRSVSFDDPDRPFVLLRQYPMESCAHENRILTRTEAAEMLGVSPGRVSALVTLGKLKCYSENPGRQGVRVWFSAAEIRAYMKSESRSTSRAYWDKYVEEKKADKWVRDRKPWQPEFGEEYLYHTNRNLRKSYGEYYTVRQAAEILGCSSRSVKHKIKMGYLKAERKNRSLYGPNDKWNDRRWWFIKKEDLQEYKGSREYRRRKRGWMKRQNPENFPDDNPKPAKPVPEHRGPGLDCEPEVIYMLPENPFRTLRRQLEAISEL